MSFGTFYGTKCTTNDKYRSIMGGPKPRSFSTLTHYTRQKIYARSTPFAHFATLNREESAFARCRGFTLHRFVPYRNHACEANQFLYSIKLYERRVPI